MSSSVESQKPRLPRSKRLKIDMACQACRLKKIKCDGARPACHNCQKKDILRDKCTYHSPGARGPISPREPEPPIPLLASAERPEGPEFRGVYYVGAPGVSAPGIFAREVKDTIDARFGLPAGGKPLLTPMTDAPLFGLLPRRQITDASAYHVDNVLPPRKHADQLVDIYWRYIQPLEPFLEQKRFTSSYEALFVGELIDGDEHDRNSTIFVSSLNAIFALSTQIQECMEPKQRDEASDIYFQRAWALLRPEAILWGPGSLEIIQCLLLMGKYLQCTNNPHQTWMAIGSAVRIAQSLGLHASESASSHCPSSERMLKRQLWQCCVFMDRGVSWVLGRASMISSTVSSSTIESPRHNGQDGLHPLPSAHYFMKTLELFEICNHIVLAHVSVGNSAACKLDLPRLYHNEEHCATVMQLDTCLSKLEKNLPQVLKHDIFEPNVDDTLQSQRVMLRLRFLHARICLFRPMLARVCFSQLEAAISPTVDQSLRDRMLQNCANLCVDSAQKMINLVYEYHKPVEAVGIIPWWYRIFYLYISGTIHIATMLRADLFTPMVSQSWNRAMLTLRAHEHLSPFVQQCLTTFQTLSYKITETHHSGGSQLPPLEGSSNTYFQDVFQDMGFDPDNFLFGKEDMSWLSNFEAFQ